MHTKYAPKGYYHGTSYKGKNAETILQYQNPELWKETALEQLNLSISDQTKNVLKYKAQVIATYTEKVKTKEYKVNKIKNKQLKKRRDALDQRNKHRYGCGCKNSDFSNGKCQCIKDDRPCGDNCECRHTGLCLNSGETGVQNREAFKKRREKKGNSTSKKHQKNEILTEDESSENSSKKRKIIMLVRK